MQTVVLLTISNVFMTFAWYGHLKFKDSPLFTVILVSGGLPLSNIVFKCRPIGSAMVSSARHSSRQSKR